MGVDVHVDEPGRRNPERHARFPAAAVRLREPGTDGQQDVSLAGQAVRGRRAPEADHAKQLGVAGRQDAGCHEAVDDREARELGQTRDGRPSASRASAGQQDRSPGPAQLGRNRRGGLVAQGRPRHGRRGHHLGIEHLAEDVHRHRHEHGTRPPGERHVPRPRQHARNLVRATDAPGALHERLVDRYLVGVAAEVELLVWAASLVVRRHVPGDHHQRDRVERRRRDARRRVRHARARRGRAGRPAGRSPWRARLPHARRPARGAPSRTAVHRGARLRQGRRCSCDRTGRRPSRRRDRPGTSRHDRRPWASPRPPRRAHQRWPPAVDSVPHAGIAFVQKERSIRIAGVSSPRRPTRLTWGLAAHYAGLAVPPCGTLTNESGTYRPAVRHAEERERWRPDRSPQRRRRALTS